MKKPYWTFVLNPGIDEGWLVTCLDSLAFPPARQLERVVRIGGSLPAKTQDLPNAEVVMNL